MGSLLSFTALAMFATLGAGAMAAAPVSEPLFQAIRTGKPAEVRRALDRGISPNAIDNDATPALLSATLFDDAASVKLLLDRGADPNAADSVGATALLWAVPDLAKVKLLLARGANVNAKSTNLGVTPLLVAAGYPNSVNILRLLVKKGADIGAKDKSGMHALGRAVLLADVESVRFLVENGADIAEPGYGEHGLGLFFARHDVSIAEYLLSRGVKVRKEALSIASNSHDVKLLDRMLAAGGDVNAPVPALKSTPLIMATAAEQTRPDTLRWLLEHGADPNAEGADGDRPLDWASYRADRSRIDLLKRYGAKPGAAARAGRYSPAEGVADARTALRRTAALLLPTGPAVFRKRGCITCHNQALPMQVGIAARQKGIAIDEGLLKTNFKQILGFFTPFAKEAMQGEQPSDGALQIGYVMMALAAHQYPLDELTASLVHLVTSLQRANGSWLCDGVSRPPLEDSDVSSTAMAVRAVTLYPLPERAKQLEAILRKARRWLIAAPANSAEERNMRLMGLVWTKAPRQDVQSALQQVLERQKPDGGWSQLDALNTDAYATGMSLYALHESGISVTDKAYRNGVAYLLRNQYADGSWLVKTRSYPVQPYFESGFPFGRHQWISAAGSSWASLAIASTLPDAKN